MKKLTAFFIFATLTIQGFATIRTVSNSDSAAQYITIQAACDASASGDSIYVSGSSTNYGAFTINNKKLAVFGPGWSPDKNSPYTALVSGCTLTGTGATGSELHGLTFISRLSINDNNAGINNVLFIRNKFQGIQINCYYSLSNYVFESNWFDNSVLTEDYGSISFSIFRNNIFYHTSNYSIYQFNGTNILFDHNLWYGPSTGSADCFYSCQNLTLTNNIFVHRNAANGNNSSFFQNNITYQCINDTPWLSIGNRNDGGNIANKDPKMVDQASVNSGTNDPLLNFMIRSGPGPANNAGNDGKDMGLLYGTDRVNWTRSRGANLPFIYKMIIANASIAIGENLQVTVDAKSN